MYFDFLRYFYTITDGFHWLTGFLGVALLALCALTPFQDGILYLIGKH